MVIDSDYLMNELSQFRGIMCSNRYTIEQKDDAFNGLIYAFLHNDMEPEDERKETVMVLFQATEYEWTRRRLYEVFHT